VGEEVGRSSIVVGRSRSGLGREVVSRAEVCAVPSGLDRASPSTQRLRAGLSNIAPSGLMRSLMRVLPSGLMSGLAGVLPSGLMSGWGRFRPIFDWGRFANYGGRGLLRVSVDCGHDAQVNLHG
jgi:hypothetical protein